MGLSAMGSAGAWFASYLKRDERQNSTTLRDRLLEMLSQVRQASTHQELDTMQAEADEILRDTLRCYEARRDRRWSLTAFNIALEQFHTAVADHRRSVLMAGAAVRRCNCARDRRARLRRCRRLRQRMARSFSPQAAIEFTDLDSAKTRFPPLVGEGRGG